MKSADDTQLFKESDQLSAWRLFLQTYRRVLDRLEDELQGQQGLSLTWYDVLIQLYKAPEHRLRMNDLAGSVLLSKSGLTRLIDRMEKAGLVERASCPSDRRGWFAVLTPRGEEVFKAAAPVHLDGIARHFANHLSGDEARALIDAFERILEAQGRPTPRASL
ncbi:MAG: MarR family transcriptional regulator [Actinomycetota bacterium]|nr:MarR family transcriptional regulator [Actinomycetota bacterium]